MKTVIKSLSLLLFIFSVFTSCVPDVEQEETIVNNQQNNNNTNNNTTTDKSINIPAGFDYKTHQKVTIRISDNSGHTKYDVFGYSDSKYYAGTETYIDESGNQVTEDVYKDDIINKPIFSGSPKNGVLNVTLTLPTYAKKVYVRRKQGLKYSGELVEINNQEVQFTYTANKGTNKRASRTTVTDLLYCVNGEGDLFQVDPLTGEYTFLSEMPMGSYTAAIDQENLVMYSIGRSNPNPLMKYDIVTGEWSTVANMGFGGPRLDYNVQDKLLYYSNSDYLRTIDPANGNVLGQWKINGLHNKNGGDLKFDETDGTFYLASFSGLYKLTFNGSSYDAARISADNLPYTPTSMTIDSDGFLWLADAVNNGNLIIMDTQTGGWEYTYGASANNDTNFNRRINDLTTLRIFNDSPDTTDTDGDGIVDSEDSFPDDADKAFEIFTPSKYGTGSIAFEDLWPSYGDYDFNDVALNYKAIAILNSDNEAVQIDFQCYVKANGAGFTNGFGIEMEGVPSNLIESVTGTNYSHDYITLNANGTEANQQNAVIIFTDDQDNFLTETTVSIKFTRPISTEQLGTAPFNPFIIKNMVRAHEIHLPYYNTTDLGQNVVEIDGISKDLDGNYISDKGYPWAISIIHDFKVPKESVAIDEAYNFFRIWATSGGLDYSDWYKDNTGYRNSSKLQN